MPQSVTWQTSDDFKSLTSSSRSAVVVYEYVSNVGQKVTGQKVTRQKVTDEKSQDKKSQDKNSQHKIWHRSLSLGQNVTMNTCTQTITMIIQNIAET